MRNVIDETELYWADLTYRDREKPMWFLLLLAFSLLPTLLWPLIFIASIFHESIFVFDYPDNAALSFLLFIGINSYPFMLIGNAALSYRLFNKNKLLSVTLTAVSIVFFSYVGYVILSYLIFLVQEALES